MADKLNVAIVGCGGISRYHLANILKTPVMRLAATMDVVESAARERAEEGGAGRDVARRHLERLGRER